MSKVLDTSPPISHNGAGKPAVLPPGTVLEGYQIIRKLSVGGFGIVYLAKDKNDAYVAIKEYLPSSLVSRSEGQFEPFVSAEKSNLFKLGLKSFFEEGRALAQISHPSVVGVHNFFRANQTIYMVMNYLQGANLQDFILAAKLLKGQKILRESTIRSLFDEVLHGLRIVHQSKILHLDIKPANLFITNTNKPVLIDFGAARQVIHNDNPSLSRPMYTPGFAAPEMYERDGELGPWSDIYAIGACMFSCMLGYPPLDAPTRIANDKLSITLAQLSGIYSDNMIELVEWSMSLNPRLRPQSVLALQKQLSDTDGLRYTDTGIAKRFKSGIDKLLT